MQAPTETTEKAAVEYPNTVSLEQTMQLGYNMIKFVGPEGNQLPATSIKDFAKRLDGEVPQTHPSFNDLKVALLQLSEYCRTMGVMGVAAWPDASKDFVASGSGLDRSATGIFSGLFKVYVKKLNEWPVGKTIPVDYDSFVTALAHQLRERRVDDIAQKVLDWKAKREDARRVLDEAVRDSLRSEHADNLHQSSPLPRNDPSEASGK